MLLAAIDESHNGAYDFLYLPIDFKVCLDFHELIFSSFYMKSELIASVFPCSRANAMLVMLLSIWCLLHISSPSMRFVS